MGTHLSVPPASCWDPDWYQWLSMAITVPLTFRIPTGGSGGRGVGRLSAVFCWRGGGRGPYDFTIKIACNVYSPYFYRYTCHLLDAQMCYCQCFPYGWFLKHFAGGSCLPVHFSVKTRQQHLARWMKIHSPHGVLRLFTYHNSFQFQQMEHFPGYDF